MIDRLVKAGLAVRQASKTDRRVKRIVLTDTGHRLYETVRAEAISVRRELLASMDPNRLAAATECLETLVELIGSAD
jgi:MarR family transcriptional regulator for hemolysin